MHRLAVVPLVFLSQACALQRSIVSQPYHPLEEPALDARWTLSDVSVAPPANPELANQHFTAMLQQIEGHLKSSLVGEPAVGRHVVAPKDAQYAVELDVKLIESDGRNGLAPVGIGASALPAAGLLAGAAAVTGPVGVAALLVGVGVGTLVGVSVNLMLPQHTHQGQLEATVRVRRAFDGVEVAQRTCRSIWSVDLNAFAREDKLALAAGDAVPELEREVAKSLRGVFTSLDAAQTLQTGAAEAQSASRDPEPPDFVR
jgi:hypothetical protein